MSGIPTGHEPKPRIVTHDGKRRTADEIATTAMEAALPLLVSSTPHKLGILLVIDPAGGAAAIAYRHNLDPSAASRIPELLREAARLIEQASR